HPGAAGAGGILPCGIRRYDPVCRRQYPGCTHPVRPEPGDHRAPSLGAPFLFNDRPSPGSGRTTKEEKKTACLLSRRSRDRGDTSLATGIKACSTAEHGTTAPVLLYLWPAPARRCCSRVLHYCPSPRQLVQQLLPKGLSDKRLQRCPGFAALLLYIM